MNERTMTDALWFKLRSIERVRSGEWRHPLGYLSSHLLLLAVDGEARITVDGRPSRLEPGRAFIGLPGRLLHVLATASGELFVIRFDTAAEKEGDAPCLELTERDSPFPLSEDIPLAAAAEFGDLCRKAARDWETGGAAGRLRAQAAFLEALGRLLEDAAAAPRDSDAALSRTIAYMERHCERTITIDELADLAGLSRYYYMRLFKMSYGVSAMDYLTKLRIDKAKRLMEQSRPRLREIARQVGYSDEFYFIRKFKQQVGIPPATYIRNRRRRIAAYSFPNIGQLLALQIVPFAAPMDQSWTDVYRRKYKTDVVTELSHNCEFNLAALRTAQPDYIIGVDAFLSPGEQEQIRTVAPALFVPWQAEDWRGHVRAIAEFLDMPEDAEAWLRAYDRMAARTREQVRRIVGQDKVLVVHWSGDGPVVYGRKTVAGVLYEDLGVSPPGRAADVECRESVKPEQLAQFGADRILLMLPGEDIRGAWERLSGSEAWQRAATNLNASVTPIDVWPWFDYSAYTQERFLRAVPAMFRTSRIDR